MSGQLDRTLALMAARWRLCEQVAHLIEAPESAKGAPGATAGEACCSRRQLRIIVLSLG